MRISARVFWLDRKNRFVETGISGLDKLLGGGIPTGNQVLLTGAPGTGKTTICMHILYNCASRGTPCVFIALDQNPESIVSNFKTEFPDLSEIDKLIKDKMLVIDGYDTASKIAANTEFESSYSMGNLISEIDGIVKSASGKLVVVDSLSFLKLMLGKTILYNKSVAFMVANLKRIGTTAILTIDVPYHDSKRMKFAQEDLLFDGIISLYKEGEDFQMQAVKMRGALHGKGMAKYDINRVGVTLK